MPSVLTCPCGAVIRVPPGRQKAHLRCPRCGAELQAAAEEGIRTAPVVAEVPVGSDALQKSPVSPGPSVGGSGSPAVPVEVIPDPELLDRDRKRATRGYRRGVRLVHL